RRLEQSNHRGRREERERRQARQQVVAQLGRRGREGDHRHGRPAEEKPRARIAKAAGPPESPEGGRRERCPGQRARDEVQRVEGEVIRERVRGRGVVRRAEAADEVPEVATDEVLADECAAPSGERDAVPAEAESEEEKSGAREEMRQAAEALLPPEEGRNGR